MSRITLHLKRRGQSPDDREDTSLFEITFSRQNPASLGFIDATTRTRQQPNASDYLTGGADVGLYFTRPMQMRRLSTIGSSRKGMSAGDSTPEGVSPTLESPRDVADMRNELIHEDHEDEIQEERRSRRRSDRTIAFAEISHTV